MRWVMFVMCLFLACYCAWSAADYMGAERWGWGAVMIVAAAVWTRVAVRSVDGRTS